MARIYAAVAGWLLFFLAMVAGSLYGAYALTLAGRNPPSVDDWKNFTTVAGLGTVASASILSAISSLLNLFAQAKTARELERVKKVLERRIPAYAALYSAATTYYRQLAPLETGAFSLDNVEAAENRMKDAEGEILYVDSEYKSAWYKFWQDARYSKEKVNRDLSQLDERKDFWRERAKVLAGDLERMKQIANPVLDS
jgi:FtsZ-binding cell division protein ZapB